MEHYMQDPEKGWKPAAQLEQKLLLLQERQLFTLQETVLALQEPSALFWKPAAQLEQKLLLLQERQLFTLHSTQLPFFTK
jgi:hypothetical protein